MNFSILINLFQVWDVRFLSKDSKNLKLKHEFWLKLIKKNDVKVINNDVLLMINSTLKSYLIQLFCM